MQKTSETYSSTNIKQVTTVEINTILLDHNLPSRNSGKRIYIKANRLKDFWFLSNSNEEPKNLNETLILYNLYKDDIQKMATVETQVTLSLKRPYKKSKQQMLTLSLKRNRKFKIPIFVFNHIYRSYIPRIKKIIKAYKAIYAKILKETRQYKSKAIIL